MFSEIDVFLELSCFFDDPSDVGNLISGSFAFSKAILNIMVQVVHGSRTDEAKFPVNQTLWGIKAPFIHHRGFPSGASGKEPACQCRRHKRHGFEPWVRRSPWWRAWQPTAVLFPGESHGQRSLAGYSPWGHKRMEHDLVTKQQ